MNHLRPAIEQEIKQAWREYTKTERAYQRSRPRYRHRHAHKLQQAEQYVNALILLLDTDKIKITINNQVN